MADKTIAQLDTCVETDVAEAALFESQIVGLTDPESRQVSLPQLRFAALDLAQLSAELASAVTDPSAALVLIQDPVLADPTTRNVRKMTVAQFQALMATRTKTLLQQAAAKVGTTAGWVVNAANNLGKLATLPASQAASTLVVPVSGLKVGDVITAFHLVGSMQSAGNAGTITADLRVLTAAAAGATDASIGAMAAPLSVTANTIVGVGNAVKAGLTHTVADGESFYVLITATTGVSVTEELQAVAVVVTGS